MPELSKALPHIAIIVGKLKFTTVTSTKVYSLVEMEKNTKVVFI